MASKLSGAQHRYGKWEKYKKLYGKYLRSGHLEDQNM
jgi:hypothetical protein